MARNRTHITAAGKTSTQPKSSSTVALAAIAHPGGGKHKPKGQKGNPKQNSRAHLKSGNWRQDY